VKYFFGLLPLLLVAMLTHSAFAANSFGNERKPLWLQWIKPDSSKQTWHAPVLTPVAAKDLAEEKRKARLAKRMADRAFYFGYDTNKDALK